MTPRRSAPSHFCRRAASVLLLVLAGTTGVAVAGMLDPPTAASPPATTGGPGATAPATPPPATAHGPTLPAASPAAASATATAATAPTVAPAAGTPDAAPGIRDLPNLIKTSEKQLSAIEVTLTSLREEMARLRQQVRHPCDEPNFNRPLLLNRLRRDVASRGMGRVELETPSVPGGGLAQLKLPVAVDGGKELCVIGFWEIGRGLSDVISWEAETSVCTTHPTLCPEIEQYGNAQDNREEDKTPRTRLRIRVPAHEPWERSGQALQHAGGAPPLWRHIFSSPALLHVGVYERRGDEWRLISAGRLDAPIRGRLASGLVVLLLVGIFYYLLARAVRRGGGDSPVPLELSTSGSKPRRGDGMSIVERLNPLRITANPFGEASLSNLQFFGFTLLIASLAFYRWMLTGVLGSFPADLLILLGVSTGGSVAARVVQQRAGLNEVTRKDLTRRGWFTGSVKWRRPRLNHLLASAGRFDLSRMQAFLFSLVVASYVLSSGVVDLGTVKIPTEMLSLMGLSQVIYVAGKAVAPAYVAAIEDGVEQLRTLEAQLVDPALTVEQKKIVRQTFDATVRRVAADFSGLFSLDVADDKLLPWLPPTPPSDRPAGTSTAPSDSSASTTPPSVGGSSDPATSGSSAPSAPPAGPNH
jgi:hypothetical protein